jgi:hypothetical protein
MKNETQYHQTNYNYINPHDFWLLVENQINNYLANPGTHYILERAKNECWLGSTHNNRDTFGLLGYLRNNFACQIKILNKFSNHVPIFFSEFGSFFKSDYFENRVLKEGAVSFNINPATVNNKSIDYLEVIKNKALFNLKIGE